MAIALELFSGTLQHLEATVGPTTVGFPGSLLVYSSGAIYLELIYLIAPVALLLWILSAIILRGRGQAPTFWTLAVLSSAAEPLLQGAAVVAMAEGAIEPLTVVLYAGHGFAFNFAAAALFRRYGLLAPVLVRLGNYKERAMSFSQEAIALYERARWRGWWHRLRAWLRGRPSRLRDVGTLSAGHALAGGHHLGAQAVPLAQIRGSEGRRDLFDDWFYPLGDRPRQRWLGIATAWLQGVPLPPVELIRLGEVYVARTLGLAPRSLQAQANSAPSARNSLFQRVGRSTAAPQVEDSPVGAAC